MDHFHYQDEQLYAENVAIKTIVEEHASPSYIYSRATLEHHWRVFDSAFATHPHMICFAVKANPNIAVLNILARLGSGFDVVSLGELERVVAAGGDPKRVVFSGVGKTSEEMERALNYGINCFNVESPAELMLLNEVAASINKVAPIALRVNPDVDAKTHPYISTGLRENKFGIAMPEVKALYLKAQTLSHIQIQGIDCHIGSQLTELDPFIEALDRLLKLLQELQQAGIEIQQIDLGGGLGVRYQHESPPHPTEQAEVILQRLQGLPYKLVLEPGRAIAANAGVFVTKVQYLKSNRDKKFVIVDGGMNDLLRPALYDAWQSIIPVEKNLQRELATYDVVGPICESGDFLGKDRELAVGQGDLLAVRSSGAYGFAMSSNYNSRPRPTEIMVDNDQFHLIRPREDVQDLFATETMLP